MATKAQKQRYSIGLDSRGMWMGSCPTCGYQVIAGAYETPQLAVIKRLQHHELTHKADAGG